MNMKKIYVLIVDKKSGIYQSGMIEEPVSEGTEIANALQHFGISYGSVTWKTSNYGEVEGTFKVVSIIVSE